MSVESGASSVNDVVEEDNSDPLLYSAQHVAKIFRVSTKTVSRWIERGEFEERNVQVLITIGGQRRFYQEEIHQLFQLMLDGKLYNETDRVHGNQTKSLSRIVGLPKSPARDPRLE